MSENTNPVSTEETENTESTENTVNTENTESTETTTPVAASVLNLAVEDVMDIIDGLNPFSTITRGALGTGNSLCCEISPSTPESVFMDKNSYIPLTLTINGKHDDLMVLSDTLNTIMDTLTRQTSYPYGNGYEIVDITAGITPRIIGREQNNAWLMACELVIKIYRKDEETA